MKQIFVANGCKFGKETIRNKYILDWITKLIFAEYFGETKEDRAFLRTMQERLEIVGNKIKLTDAEKVKLARCIATYSDFNDTKIARTF